MFKSIFSTLALITTVSSVGEYESYCNGNSPCIDLIQDDIHHHIMSLTSSGVAHIERPTTIPASWDCTCSNCDGLVGTWDCPGFYDTIIIVDSDTTDSNNRFTAHSACNTNCESQLCLAAPTASPTLAPTTEYNGDYLQEICNEYLNVKDDLQHKYFNYLLAFSSSITFVVLCLFVCVCKKNKKIKSLKQKLMDINPGVASYV